MILTLFIIAATVLSINGFITSTIIGFLQKTFSIKQLFSLKFALGIIVCVVLFLGLLAGKFFLTLYTDLAVWYAATILFLLSLKLFYDGIKLSKFRKEINPTDPKGLFAMSVFSSLNAFFIGLAFGFLNLPSFKLLYALVLLFIGIIIGYVSGFRLKKLIAVRIELFEALIFFIMAIVIITKL